MCCAIGCFVLALRKCTRVNEEQMKKENNGNMMLVRELPGCVCVDERKRERELSMYKKMNESV